MQKVMIAAAMAALLAAPASAGQFGGLDKVGKVTKKAQQFKDVEMTDEDEQELGAAVSQKIRDRYAAEAAQVKARRDLTPAGRRQLSEEKRNWRRVTTAVNQVLAEEA